MNLDYSKCLTNMYSFNHLTGLWKSRYYSWPLNDASARGADTPHSQKSMCYFTVSPPYPRFHIWRFNQSWIIYSVLVTQSCPTLCNPMDCILSGCSIRGNLQARVLEWVAIPFSRGSSNPQIKPGSPALQADSLSSEPTGKPKNTGVGSLSLLQGIFPTQGSTGVSCIAGRFFTSYMYTVIGIYWKKAACKWTLTVQTHVFQGSTVLFLFYK